jgi:hypothetical protein
MMTKEMLECWMLSKKLSGIRIFTVSQLGQMSISIPSSIRVRPEPLVTD